MDEDWEIVQRVLSGEKEEFARLMERYGPRVYRGILSLVGNPEDADDIYQETFHRAYRYLPSYRKEYSFFTWLHRIFLREVSKFFQRKRRFKVLSLNGEELNIFPLRRGEGGFENKEEEAKIWRALERLSEKKRAVLILKVVQQLSLKEIGEILGLSLDNVKILLYRSRKELARYLFRE